MSTFRVSSSARVNAPAAVAYRLIADYKEGHPRIAPPKYFSNFVVEEGGYGAGTRISFDMTVFGVTQRSQAAIEEPKPGRLLLERIPDRGVVTTFEVEPAGERACVVTIATEMERKPGLRGAIERFVSARLLPKIYRAELSRLDEVAVGRSRT